MQRYPGFDYIADSRKPPEPGQVRPFTAWSADLIEQCLRRNDDRGKPPWEETPVGTLWGKLIEEILELKHEIEAEEPNHDRISSEAGDVMAVAGMIAARLDPEKSKLRRGRDHVGS